MLNEQLQKQIEQEAESNTLDFKDNNDYQAGKIDGYKEGYEIAGEIYAEKWQSAQQLVERYEKALKAIISPIAYLQRKAVDEGAILGGQMAQYLANNVSFLQEIATKALTPKTGSDE